MVAEIGMTMLNTFSDISPFWRTIQIIAVVGILISALLGLIFLEVDTICHISLASALTCLVAVLVIAVVPQCNTTYYQVMFDDTASINKIYEDYNVLNTEGKIWTIIPKSSIR